MFLLGSSVKSNYEVWSSNVKPWKINSEIRDKDQTSSTSKWELNVFVIFRLNEAYPRTRFEHQVTERAPGAKGTPIIQRHCRNPSGHRFYSSFCHALVPKWSCNGKQKLGWELELELLRDCVPLLIQWFWLVHTYRSTWLTWVTANTSLGGGTKLKRYLGAEYDAYLSFLILKSLMAGSLQVFLAFLLFMYECFAFGIYVHVWWVCRSEEGIGSPETGQGVISYHVDAENWTHAFYKKNKCS